MVRERERYQKAVRSLWSARAAVTVRERVTDPATGRISLAERVTAQDIPCRLSYKTVTANAEAESAAVTAQAVTLYIDPAVEIPEGARVTVTQKGVTRSYARSGTPAVYTAHKEVPLELFRGWC